METTVPTGRAASAAGSGAGRPLAGASAVEPRRDGPVIFGAAEGFQRADDYLLRIAEAVGDGVFYVDLASGQVGLSRHWPRVVGHPLEIAVGGWPALRKVLEPRDVRRLRQRLRTLAQSRDDSVSRLELRVQRADGDTGWVLVRAMYVDEGNGRPRLVGAFSDITEHKALQARLAERLETSAAMLAAQTGLARAAQAAREEAERNVQLRGSFLANMSHELRTPMHGVIGMAELLLESPLDAEQRATAGTLLNSAESLLAILNDILDFSKLEADAVEFEHEPFDLHQALDDVGALLGVQAARKGLDLVVDIADELPQRVLGDRARLRQILVNLAGNAIKFTERGHVTIRARRAPLADGRPGFTIAVLDTGIGIAPEVLGRLFNPFTQADASVTRRFGGTGLGLAISRRFARCMGGDIDVASEPGAGSTFTLHMPLDAPAGGPPDADGADAEASPRTRFDGRRVLVVDDLAVNREIAARTLARAGCAVTAVVGGEQAIALLTESPAPAFDLLLVDGRMPGLSGPDTLARLERLLGDAMPPAILASSDGSAREAQALRSVRAVALKPLRRAQLLDAVERALRGDACAGGRPAGAAEAADGTPDAAGAAARCAHAPAASPSPGAAVPAGDVAAPLSILVADDHPTNRELIARMLGGFGRSATMVVDGAAALEAVRAQRFDLVLMDVQMPVMSGPEATRAIRAWEAETGSRRTCIVALTANAMPGDREAFLAAGMDGYLAKPFRRAELVALLASLAPAANAAEAGPASTSAPAAAPAAAPEAPLFDRAAFDDAFGGGAPAEQAEVVAITLDSLADFERRQVDARTGADAPALRSLLHRLAGGTGIAGCARLSAQARALEHRLVDRPDTGAIDAEFDRLLGTLADTRRVLRSLSDLLSGKAPADGALQETPGHR